MIEIAEALRRVAESVRPLPVETLPLPAAAGRVLAEPVLFDTDIPPFDKSMMDGFALRTDDASANETQLQVAGKITAGQRFPETLTPGTAVQLMTGCPVPDGADAVVMIEAPRPDFPRGRVTLLSTPVQRGANILRRGSLARRGDPVLPHPHRIGPRDIGRLVEAGAQTLRAFRQPRVAVLTTGDELCPAGAVPGASQIRDSNGPLLRQLATASSAQVVDLGWSPDQAAPLRQGIHRGLEADLLLLTGGVSAGELDLVPGALADCGVRPLFHQVAMKPGKPIWFGSSDRDAQRCLVFGLPGNPVSALVGFYLFVRPTLRALQGLPFHEPAWVGNLARRHAARGDRPTYWPARWFGDRGRLIIDPLPWKGSADQRCLSDANALAIFPAGDAVYEVDQPIEFLPLD